MGCPTGSWHMETLPQASPIGMVRVSLRKNAKAGMRLTQT